VPLVDVTDILLDPDIAGQSFTVLRRQETVNSYGESTWFTAKIPAIGAVQPEGENDLIRDADFDAQTKTISVVTAYRLRGVSKGPNSSRYKPDLVIWNNNYFEVVSLKSWGTFGYGFVEATCTAVHYVDLPPIAPPLPYGQLDFSRPVNAGYAHGAGGA
jgi:hypothetical protein